MTRYNITPFREAEAQGYIPITSGYTSEEYPILDKAIATLEGVPHLLVSSTEGIHICRKQLEINTIKENLG